MKRSAGIPGLPALIGLLLVVFVIAGLLVYEAWNTARSRRDIVERGLQDYAAYATWSTARTGEVALLASLSTIFRDFATGEPRVGEPAGALAKLESGARYLQTCGCAMEIPADYYFRFVFRDSSLQIRVRNPLPLAHGSQPGWASGKVGSFVVIPEAEIPDERQWLRQTVLRSSPPQKGPALLLEPNGDSIRVVGFTPLHDSDGRPTGVAGFVGSGRRFADSAFAYLWRNPKLLPFSITRGTPNDSLLAAVVTSPGGSEIYRSNGWIDGLRSDTATIGGMGAGIKVRVALRGDAASRLQGEVVPASRVPVWVGLLLLTGFLTAIIVRNIQQEQELSRQRLEFSASVSHELRTPLAQILLFGETLTLGRTRSDVERSTAAGVIVREARRLMLLVDNALSFSRSEPGASSRARVRARLDEIVHEVVAGFDPIARARKVDITLDLEAGVEAFIDGEALRQILLNLLDNAVKYGPSGQTVAIGLWLDRLHVVDMNRAGSSLVRLTVDDEGPGVSGRARKDIWNPFVRGTNGESPVGTGCGLGLSVVKELAERHGGTVWVEASPGGKGSRFVVQLRAPAEPAYSGAVAEPATGSTR
ncbi:MAG: HAMP domain-containing sensor histidine kinase [Gemmatimonadaceae bacterium]